jgi:hypothetical protein
MDFEFRDADDEHTLKFSCEDELAQFVISEHFSTDDDDGNVKEIAVFHTDSEEGTKALVRKMRDFLDHSTLIIPHGPNMVCPGLSCYAADATHYPHGLNFDKVFINQECCVATQMFLFQNLCEYGSLIPCYFYCIEPTKTK